MTSAATFVFDQEPADRIFTGGPVLNMNDALTLQQDVVWGADADSAGDGSIIPVNTALAFPGASAISAGV